MTRSASAGTAGSSGAQRSLCSDPAGLPADPVRKCSNITHHSLRVASLRRFASLFFWKKTVQDVYQSVLREEIPSRLLFFLSANAWCPAGTFIQSCGGGAGRGGLFAVCYLL